MERQLTMDINDEIETISIKENVSIDQKNNEVLLYENRMKKLIKEIASSENMDVQCSQEGLAKLQSESEFLVSLLIFEALESLSKSGGRRLMEKHIELAMDKILDQASVLDISIELLSENIDKLKGLRKATTIKKATEFVNR